MARMRPIRGSTGDWVLRLESPDRSRLLACFEIITDHLPRARIEFSRKKNKAECAIEMVSRESASSLIEALEKFYKHKRTKVSYSLGNVNAGTVDTGTIVDR